MNAFTTVTLVGSILLLGGRTATAQVKTLPGESVTATATVEAIETSTRTLTIKNDKGIYETMQVPAEVKRFDALKIGDRITVRYYDNVVVCLKKPGEAAVELLGQEALTPSPGKMPGGTAAAQQTVTLTVTAIDPKVPSITVKGPNGYVYSRKVTDKKALAQLKVGDQLDVTWTAAVLVSVEPAK
jgi:hypothetical protein